MCGTTGPSAHTLDLISFKGILRSSEMGIMMHILQVRKQTVEFK